VEGAEVFAMSFEAEGAGVDAFEGVDRIDYFENAELGGGLDGLETSAWPAPAGDDAGAGQGIEDFRKVVERDFGFAGDVVRGAGGGGFGGEGDHGPEGVLSGLGQHEM